MNVNTFIIVLLSTLIQFGVAQDYPRFRPRRMRGPPPTFGRPSVKKTPPVIVRPVKTSTHLGDTLPKKDPHAPSARIDPIQKKMYDAMGAKTRDEFLAKVREFQRKHYRSKHLSVKVNPSKKPPPVKVSPHVKSPLPKKDSPVQQLLSDPTSSVIRKMYGSIGAKNKDEFLRKVREMQRQYYGYKGSFGKAKNPIKGSVINLKVPIKDSMGKTNLPVKDPALHVNPLPFHLRASGSVPGRMTHHDRIKATAVDKVQGVIGIKPSSGLPKIPNPKIQSNAVPIGVNIGPTVPLVPGQVAHLDAKANSMDNSVLHQVEQTRQNVMNEGVPPISLPRLPVEPNINFAGVPLAPLRGPLTHIDPNINADVQPLRDSRLPANSGITHIQGPGPLFPIGSGINSGSPSFSGRDPLVPDVAPVHVPPIPSRPRTIPDVASLPGPEPLPRENFGPGSPSFPAPLPPAGDINLGPEPLPRGNFGPGSPSFPAPLPPAGDINLGPKQFSDSGVSLNPDRLIDGHVSQSGQLGPAQASLVEESQIQAVLANKDAAQEPPVRVVPKRDMPTISNRNRGTSANNAQTAPITSGVVHGAPTFGEPTVPLDSGINVGAPSFVDPINGSPITFDSPNSGPSVDIGSPTFGAPESAIHTNSRVGQRVSPSLDSHARVLDTGIGPFAPQLSLVKEPPIQALPTVDAVKDLSRNGIADANSVPKVEIARARQEILPPKDITNPKATHSSIALSPIKFASASDAHNPNIVPTDSVKKAISPPKVQIDPAKTDVPHPNVPVDLVKEGSLPQSGLASVNFGGPLLDSERVHGHRPFAVGDPTVLGDNGRIIGEVPLKQRDHGSIVRSNSDFQPDSRVQVRLPPPEPNLNTGPHLRNPATDFGPEPLSKSGLTPVDFSSSGQPVITLDTVNRDILPPPGSGADSQTFDPSVTFNHVNRNLPSRSPGVNDIPRSHDVPDPISLVGRDRTPAELGLPRLGGVGRGENFREGVRPGERITPLETGSPSGGPNTFVPQGNTLGLPGVGPSENTIHPPTRAFATQAEAPIRDVPESAPVRTRNTLDSAADRSNLPHIPRAKERVNQFSEQPSAGEGNNAAENQLPFQSKVLGSVGSPPSLPPDSPVFRPDGAADQIVDALIGGQPLPADMDERLMILARVAARLNLVTTEIDPNVLDQSDPAHGSSAEGGHGQGGGQATRV